MNRLLLLIYFIIAQFTISAQIKADFVANQTSGCGSIQVSFTNKSSSSFGKIIGYSWDLGGVKSTLENPGRIFSTPGFYDICLTVTDEKGNTNTECKKQFIQVFKLPAPDFSIDKKSGCVPLNVSFFDKTLIGSSNIYKWIWDIGGEKGVVIDTIGNLNLSNTYQNAGIYKASLTVIDKNGCSQTISKNNLITVFENPNLELVQSDYFSCIPPFTPKFEIKYPSIDVDYNWTFSNGQKLVGNIVQPSFDQNGSYSISISAKNRITGCENTKVFSNTINVGNEVVINFQTTRNCIKTNLLFSDKSNIKADSIKWDFDDGTYSNEKEVAHSYLSDGCYKISLTRFLNGCETKKTLDTCIKIFKPAKIDLDISPKNDCTIPKTINFKYVSQDSILNTIWKLDSQIIGTTKNTSFNINQYGRYPFTLYVEDLNHCESIFIDTINIQKLTAKLSKSKIEGCKPLTFTLSDSSLTDSPITNWYWEVNGKIDSNSTPTFTISDTGVYSIKLAVKNLSGCSDTILLKDIIKVGQPPILDILVTPKKSCLIDSLQFIYNGTSNANKFYWQFGDSTNSILKNPWHTYNNFGFFDVSLIAYHYNCPSSIFKPNFVELFAPLAAFDVIRSCSNPLNIQFVDKSILADSIWWDFGISNSFTDTSTLSNPSFIYPDTGSYTVTLFAKNDSTGCTHIKKQEIRIYQPIPNFTIDTLFGCSPLTIKLQNISKYTDTIKWFSLTGKLESDMLDSTKITFEKPGAFNDFGIIVKDKNGCIDSLFSKDTVKANNIIPKIFINNHEGCLPLNLNIKDSSYTYFSNITSRIWLIDSIPFTFKDSSFILNEAKSIAIKLQLLDDFGCKGVLFDTISGFRPIPIMEFDTVFCSNIPIDFKCSSQGEKLNYFWDFGNGMISAERNPSIKFSIEGTFKVCLTVSENNICDSTLCKNLTIKNPKADFLVDKNFGECPPLFTNFANLSLNSNSFIWNFGDSSGISNINVPSHVFTEPGKYTIQLISKLNDKCADTLTKIDYIRLEGPIGNFTYKIDSSCVPVKVHFVAKSDQPYTYIWDFGDGNIDSSSTKNVIDSFSYTYNEIGKFVPKLTLVNAANCSRTYIGNDTIIVADLKINFSAKDSILCGNAELKLFNLTSSLYPIDSLIWIANGSNENFSYENNPIFHFMNEGIYNIELIAKSGYCVDTLIKNNFIKIGSNPNAIIKLSSKIGCEPFRVSFTDQSVPNSGIISERIWNYGNESNTKINFLDTLIEGDYIVKLKVKNSLGCESISYDTIKVLPEIKFDLATTKSTICKGELLTINALINSDTSGLKYSWSPFSHISCSNCLSPIVSPNETTAYYFTASNQIGCFKKDSVKINVLPYSIPTIHISNDTSICENSYSRIIVSSNDDNVSFYWDKSKKGLSCYDLCKNPIASPDSTIIYSVKAISKEGCENKDSVKIKVIKSPISILGADYIICEGDTLQLNLDKNYSYEWLNSKKVSCIFCNNPKVFPDSTINLIAKIKSDICSFNDTIKINLIPKSTIDAGMDLSLCRGSEVMLNASSIGSVKWTPNLNISNDTIKNPIIKPSETTIYYLNSKIGNCNLIDSIKITIVDKSEITGNQYIGCIGDTIQLKYTGNVDKIKWNNFDNLILKDSLFPFLVIKENTNFIVSGNLNGCAEDTALITIKAKKIPNLDITDNHYFIKDKISIFSIINKQNYQLKWSPKDLIDCDTCNTFYFKSDSSFSIHLIAFDSLQGCYLNKKIYFLTQSNCLKDLVYIPNIFSPNNDGVNDKFLVYTQYPEYFKSMSIYDRWGELIFSSKNINDGWDGLFNGKLMDNGIFVYVIEMICPQTNLPTIISADVMLAK